MDSILLHCQLPVTRGEFLCRTCVIERKTDEKTTSTDTLWIEMPRLAILPEEDDAESFLILALLPAMAEGRDIHIEGAVSQKLLSNLCEFRDIWHSWNPVFFKKIEFSNTRLLEHKLPAERTGAVAAFSGGGDSTFTTWRHKTGAAGHRSIDLRCCIMVHGFDIPLRKEETFKRVFVRCQETLKTLDLKLYPLRTNCRTIFTLNWEIWHGPAVGACLQLFKGECSAGLIANTYNSNSMVFPWGSNPITDPMLSTEGFEIIHDGIAFSRLQKFVALREWEAGYNNLRVCFTGIDRDIIQEGNCGKCTKCVRTLLVIQFAGLPIPASFPGPVSAKDIIRMRPSAALAHGWRVTLKEAVKLKQPFSIILAVAWIWFASSLASVFKKALRAAGILEPSFH